jgi:hypothetical protein
VSNRVWATVAFRPTLTLGLVMTKAWLVTVLAMGAFVASSASVQASCAGPPSLRDQLATAPLVFVGTVAFTSDNDRVARVRVESTWKGPNLPAYVDVHGSPVSGPFAASSADRTYRAGERDLFVLFSDRSPLQDNNCSATQIYTNELAAFAPADARPPAPITASDQIQNSISQYWLQTVIAVLIVAVAAFIGLRALARSRKTQGP